MVAKARNSGFRAGSSAISECPWRLMAYLTAFLSEEFPLKGITSGVGKGRFLNNEQCGQSEIFPETWQTQRNIESQCRFTFSQEAQPFRKTTRDCFG